MREDDRRAPRLPENLDPALAAYLRGLEDGYIRRADANANAIARLGQRTFWVLAFVAAVALAGGILSTSLEFRYGQTAAAAKRAASSAQAASHSAAQTAHQAVLLVGAEQANRVALCREDNRRHRDTVRVIRRLTARAAAHAPQAQRARISTGLRETLLVIDALAPRRDCSKLLSR